jgi:membrane protein implicated in regulation of membrane protease activity
MFATKMELPVGITTLHLSRKSLYLLVLAVALVGAGGYSYVQQGQAVDDAVTVQATVDSAQVERIDSRRSIDYEPEIKYTYRYRGETYTSEQVFPGPTIRTYSDRSEAQSVVRSYEPGTTVRAYVRPSAPGDAFLIEERTPWPVRAFAIGGVLLGIVVLAGLGEKHPGQHELRPASEVRSPPSRTWVERNGEPIRRLSKRGLAACFVAFWLSMIGLFFGILSLTEGTESSVQPVQADLLGPVGLPLLAGLGFWVGMILSLCLYGVWSFTQYRQLRRRLHEPRPPSPFRHPSRLVTILGTASDELPEYGRRVRVTGWSFLIASGMTAVLVQLLYTAS